MQSMKSILIKDTTKEEREKNAKRLSLMHLAVAVIVQCAVPVAEWKSTISST